MQWADYQDKTLAGWGSLFMVFPWPCKPPHIGIRYRPTCIFMRATCRGLGLSCLLCPTTDKDPTHVYWIYKSQESIFPTESTNLFSRNLCRAKLSIDISDSDSSCATELLNSFSFSPTAICYCLYWTFILCWFLWNGQSSRLSLAPYKGEIVKIVDVPY